MLDYDAETNCAVLLLVRGKIKLADSQKTRSSIITRIRDAEMV